MDAATASAADYDLIGIQVHTGNLLQAGAFLAELRTQKSRATLVVGGPSANITYKYFSQLGLADYFVLGDGIHAFNSILKGAPTGANVIATTKPSLIAATHEIPNGKWQTPNFRQIYKRSFQLLPFLSTTGCPFNCSFCTSRRDLVGFDFSQNLIDGLSNFIELNSPKVIRFNDSTFNGHLPTFRKALNILTSSSNQPKWGAYIALSSLKHADIQNMAESGCAYVYIGIESSAYEVRRNANKVFRDHEARAKLGALRQAGIRVLTSFIVDLPGSEQQSTDEMAEYVRGLNPDAVHFFPYEDRPNLVETVPAEQYWRALLGRTTHRALAPQSKISFDSWRRTLARVSILKRHFADAGIFTSETAMVNTLLKGEIA